MRTSLLKFLIESAVPFLNLFRNPPKWPYTLEDHRNFSKNSVANDMALLLDKQKLPLLPKYEDHDAIHVILGYGTTPLEEMKLQAFMIGNQNATFPGKVLFVIGLVIKPEYWKTLKQEIKRGKAANKIPKNAIADLLPSLTTNVRKELNITCS